MTLEDFGNIGEMVGGLAVVISLLYLAVQIRQNSRIARFEAHRALSVAMGSVISDVARDPEMYRIWKAAVDAPEEATYDDRERFGMILYQVFTTFSDADRFSSLDPELTKRYNLFLDRYIRMPAVQEWWSRQGEHFPRAFRERVQRRMDRIRNAETP